MSIVRNVWQWYGWYKTKKNEVKCCCRMVLLQTGKLILKPRPSTWQELPVWGRADCQRALHGRNKGCTSWCQEAVPVIGCGFRKHLWRLFVPNVMLCALGLKSSSAKWKKPFFSFFIKRLQCWNWERYTSHLGQTVMIVTGRLLLRELFFTDFAFWMEWLPTASMQLTLFQDFTAPEMLISLYPWSMYSRNL